jgi:uncharacterized repeat protein (TIGR03803 family)
MNKLSWWKTVCAVGMFGAAAIAAPAQTFRTLASFDGTGGTYPGASLIQATDGNFYGTTEQGGASATCQNGCGTVFKVTRSGALTTLYSFCSQSGCADGSEPAAALVQATDGNFYGTTFQGGSDFGCTSGCGTIFKITPGGTLTTLYSFCSQTGCPDGANPLAPLVKAADGSFYGTTANGGANVSACLQGCGTVFSITPNGTLTTLYRFCSESGCPDGAGPSGPLVQATDGKFYGTNAHGSASTAGGTIFKITPGGTLTTLHVFGSQSGDGYAPTGGVAQASDGNFYGTTIQGGAGEACFGAPCGTVFKITPSGTLTTLYSFNFTDGANPFGGLIQASDGSFYGTTFYGGAYSTGADSGGTAFEITPSGTLTTLYNFCFRSGCIDGNDPVAGLVQDTNGRLYGTTSDGGASHACTGGCGTTFSLSVGLEPFVETLPTFGKVGKPVKILGTNLTGATSVTFNGVPATFTVASGPLIKATVPAGATTGTVQVVTPSGTLSSNVPFTVVP